MLKAKLFGDWSRVGDILGQSEKLKKAINQAVLQEAQFARTAVVKGITAQAPGGRPFEALSALTLALRRAKGFRGKKVMMVTGGLRNSVTVKQVASGKVFLGVLRGARGKSGQNLYNVAAIQENGATIVIRVTPKMKRWLMMELRKSGFSAKATGRDRKGRFKRTKASGTGQLSKGVIVVRIKARPFISPVIDKIASNPAAMQQRLAKTVAQKMGLALGD